MIVCYFSANFTKFMVGRLIYVDARIKKINVLSDYCFRHLCAFSLSVSSFSFIFSLFHFVFHSHMHTCTF